MDWELAIEKNHEALKRVLAMLVAMAGMGDARGSAATGAGDALTPPSVLPDISPSRGEITLPPGIPPIANVAGEEPSAPLLISPLEGEMSGRTEGGAVEHGSQPSLPNTLPRHLHRFVLRLLRPAEAAVRRLIIIAARGLVVKLPKLREPKPRPKKPLLNRKNGYGTNIVIRPGPLPEWAKALVPKRSPRLSLPLMDPMKRFGVRRRYAKPGVMPRIRVLGDYDPIVPFFRQPEPLPPPAPTADDPLDAASIHRRLDVLARALDDLPKQALRMARWQARRDARRAAERAASKPAQPDVENTPSPSRPFDKLRASPPLPHFMGARKSQAGAPSAPPQFLAPTQWGRGGEGEARDGEGVKGQDGEGVDWQELGVTPEALALIRRRKDGSAQASISPAASPKTRRFHRMSPMRPGRPPGWRKRQNHEVYEVLTELHGLAVWASERRDSS